MVDALDNLAESAERSVRAREQMLGALVACVEQGPSGIRVLDVTAIRSARES